MLRIAVGHVLRVRRGDRTLRSLSRVSGISMSYISEVERGIKDPSSEVLEDLCMSLGITLTDVIREAADVLDKYPSKR